MSLNFPNRLLWLFIGVVMFVLLQSGCAPMQLPANAQPLATPAQVEEEAAAERANLSTDIRNETISPSGEWTATTLFQVPAEGDEYYQSLVITHTSGAPSYTLVDGWFPMGLGYTVATPFTWSQDEARFYYTNRAQSDGCGILFDSTDLYQVDLGSGETTEILPANSATTLALSPDEQHVAYLAPGTRDLRIQETSSGESMPVDIATLLDDDQAGALAWSPDSTQLAFAVAHSPCVGGWAEATSIYTLDITTLGLTPHLEVDDRLLIPVAWPSENILVVENQVPFDQIENKQQYNFDLTTNTVTQ